MSAPNEKDPRIDQPGASDDSLQDVHGALLREKPEPGEGAVPIPLLLLGLIGGLVFFSGIYLGRYSGNFDPLVYNEEAGAAGAAAAGPSAAPDPITVGKRLFAQNCATCHQATGQGLPGVYPPLAGSEWATGNPEAVGRILLHGLSGPVDVHGATYNGAMPSFGPLGSNWKDDRIAAVLTYVRQEWGNKAAPITTEQIAAIRAATASRNKAWTAAELEEFRK
ncbi:MAG TPA: cytochrome c [Opitutaceae bacterium]|nr:cytochrome c [Opitutaceae bacterium]